MAARSPGSTFLDFGDPLGGLGQTLMQLAIQRQQLDLQKERLKLDQKEADQRASYQSGQLANQAFQQAQTQGPQIAAAQSLLPMLGAAMPVLPGAGGMPTPNPGFTGPASPALSVAGGVISDPTLSRDQKLAAIGIAGGSKEERATGVMALIEAEQQKKADAKFIEDSLKIVMPENRAAVRQALEAEMRGLTGAAQFLMPPDEKQALELIEASNRIKMFESNFAKDTSATAILRAYGVPGHDRPHVEGAYKTLQDLLADWRKERLEKIKGAEDRRRDEAAGDAIRMYAGGTPREAVQAALLQKYGDISRGELYKIAFDNEEYVQKLTGLPGERRGQAEFFYPIVSEANKTVMELEAQGIRPNLFHRAVDKLPLGAGRFLIPGPEERMINSLEVIASGLLRIETGAQANAQEINSVVRRISSLPGEDAATVATRARLRNVIIETIRQAGGISDRPGQATERAIAAFPGGVMPRAVLDVLEQALGVDGLEKMRRRAREAAARATPQDTTVIR